MKPRVILVAIVIAWAALVVAAYFAIHKPISPDRALALARAAVLLRWLVTLGWWAVMVEVAGGLGRWLIRDLGESPIERIAFSFGVGFGALSGLVLVAGLLGLMSNRVAGILALLVLAGALIQPARAMARDLRDALPRRWPDERLARITFAFVGLMLAMAFLWALTPPTAWDSLTYHLNGPKLYLEQGRIAHTLDLPYLGFPQLVEMLYLLAMIANVPASAQLIHWTFAVLIVALLVDFTARRWNRPTGWLAAAVLMSAPTIFWLAGWAYVDLALAFYTLAAFVALTLPRFAGERIVLAGVMCGLAMATKYTAASVAVALAVLVWRARREPGARLMNVACLSLVAALVAAPWYIKTWLTTGNPFYPFFGGGVFWDAWRAWWYSRWGTGLAFTAPWRLLTAPLEMTVLGIEGAEGFGSTIGPLLLMLVPLVALAWRRMDEAQRQVTTHALVMCGIVYLVWLAQVGGSALLVQTRLLLPILPLLAMLAAVGFDGLDGLEGAQISARRVVGALVVLTLVLTLGGLAWDGLASDRLVFLLGARSHDDYLRAHLGAHYAAMQAVNELPPEARVVFLWEPRSFYCRVECWPDSLLDRWWHLRRTLNSPAAIAQEWQRQGFTHVLLYRTGYEAIVEAGFDPITLDDQVALDNLLHERARLIQDVGGAYSLFVLER